MALFTGVIQLGCPSRITYLRGHDFSQLKAFITAAFLTSQMLYQFGQMKLSEKNHLGLIAFVIASSLSAQPTQKSFELEYGTCLRVQVVSLHLC